MFYGVGYKCRNRQTEVLKTQKIFVYEQKTVSQYRITYTSVVV